MTLELYPVSFFTKLHFGIVEIAVAVIALLNLTVMLYNAHSTKRTTEVIHTEICNFIVFLTPLSFIHRCPLLAYFHPLPCLWTYHDHDSLFCT